MVVKASLSDLSIVEVPTKLKPDGRSRAPHLRTWHDGWRHLRFLLLCSPRWLFMYPGLLAMTVGLVGVVALQFGPLTIGHVTLSTVSLVFFAFLTIIGFQIISFGIAARHLATVLGVLPPRTGSRLLTHFTLERGLVLSGCLLLVGLAVLVVVVGNWVSAGLGQLDGVATLRRAIPGLMLVAIGTQAVFTSFFLVDAIGKERA